MKGRMPGVKTRGQNERQERWKTTRGDNELEVERKRADGKDRRRIIERTEEKLKGRTRRK